MPAWTPTVPYGADPAQPAQQQGQPYSYGPPPPTSPGPGGSYQYPGPGALQPPTVRRVAQMSGMFFEQVPAALPYPWLPQSSDPGRPVARNPREYVLTYTWGTDITAVGTASIKRINWDTIGAVYALVAGIYKTDGTAFPINWNTLNAFTVGIQQANGYQYVTVDSGVSVLGGCIFSNDAGRPAYIPAGAWPIDRGTVLQVTLTPLIANITVHLNFRTIEAPGPTNLNFYPAGQ